MKLQLDTDQKTIKIEESVNIGEFIKTLNQLLPNDIWKEFTLEVSPIIINPIPYIPVPQYPLQPYYHELPWITCNANGNGRIYPNDNNFSLNKGIFNIEM